MAEPIATGWHYLKSGAREDCRVGPLSWDELCDLAHSGALWPIDLVWHPSLPQWHEAELIPGLFPVVPPGTRRRKTLRPPSAPPADAPTEQPGKEGLPLYQPSWAERPLPPRRGVRPFAILVAALVVLAAIGTATYYGLWLHTGDRARERVDLGVTRVRLPDSTRMVDTETWGRVPANQFGVLLEQGSTKEDAEAVASALGGSVVGEIEFISAYQIKTQGRSEIDLRETLETASSLKLVVAAFPDLQTTDHTEIQGIRSSPLNDPIYVDAADSGLETIGIQRAWDYMRGSLLPLSEVHVGIVDSGLYLGSGEFSGDVAVRFPDGTAGKLSSPGTILDPDTGKALVDPTGGHGTMIAAIIGGDPEDGGITGLASPALGDLLTISMIDRYAGQYGTAARSTPSALDPSRSTWRPGASFAFAGLVAIAREAEAGARIIICCWGGEAGGRDPGVASAYRAFFAKMADAYPSVLFVCSAGNGGGPGDGTHAFPGGSHLPNVITVGNVADDGSAARSSTTINALVDHEFEVSLAAPGEETVQGVDAEGAPIDAHTNLGDGVTRGGGTSLAAAQVAAAAALVVSLVPNLSAAEIKDILVDTGRPGPESLGGKILAVDQAVLAVIRQERARLGLVRLTADQLQKAGTIDATAVSLDDESWMVKATVEVLPSPGGAEVSIAASEGVEIGSVRTRRIVAPREVVWAPVKVPGGAVQITVTRADTGASTVITIEPTP